LGLRFYEPHTPDHPPPDLSPVVDSCVSSDEDNGLLRILKLREIAVELAGGQERWDSLTSDEMDELLERAEKS
jgi:hypothetical protein